jgi:hypothetical protein
MVKRRAFLRKMLGSLGIMLLVLSSSGDALGLHRCPHHDALPSADEPAPAHSHHNNDSAPAGEESSSACTCVGTCATVNTAVLAPAATAFVADVAPSTIVLHSIIPASETPAAPQFLLPFSTAPPASR